MMLDMKLSYDEYDSLLNTQETPNVHIGTHA